MSLVLGECLMKLWSTFCLILGETCAFVGVFGCLNELILTSIFSLLFLLPVECMLLEPSKTKPK